MFNDNQYDRLMGQLAAQSNYPNHPYNAFRTSFAYQSLTREGAAAAAVQLIKTKNNKKLLLLEI